MCSGPVSPDTISDARRDSASRSAIVVAGAIARAPPDAATTSRASGLLARPPQHERLQPADVAQERRHLAEARRPASACSATPRPD